VATIVFSFMNHTSQLLLSAVHPDEI
jgi:hypothetical protein